jgi:hypothetical protein
MNGIPERKQEAEEDIYEELWTGLWTFISMWKGPLSALDGD